MPIWITGSVCAEVIACLALCPLEVCRISMVTSSVATEIGNVAGTTVSTSLTNTFKSSYLETQRENVNVNKIIRDPKNAEMIKSIYDFRCQVCRIRLDTPYKRPIAIGAHIKGLGTPHNGPDNIENMLCLCPNHHDQFDKYSYSVNPLDHSIVGLKEYQNQKLFKDKKHKLNDAFLDYHYKYF